MTQIADHMSPNFNDRPAGSSIDMVILHYTGMLTGAAALERMCDASSKVSAHYMIEEDGRIFRLVPEDRRAWHAGLSCWQGRHNLNDCSIGIELVNPGHEFGYRPFPEEQMSSLIKLAQDIVGRNGIKPSRVLGHSDVAPLRKEDPGELFDWKRLQDAGLGIYPGSLAAGWGNAPELNSGMRGPAVLGLQIALDAIGYQIEGSGHYDAQTEAVVRAFQRHFRQSRVDGISDPETSGLIHLIAGA